MVYLPYRAGLIVPYALNSFHVGFRFSRKISALSVHHKNGLHHNISHDAKIPLIAERRNALN
jgi:hypothetical protein